MQVWEAFFLGIGQGLTEFLPVSSSGHLVIAQKILNLKEPTALFDIFIHLGTLLAVFFYFKKKIISFYLNRKNWFLLAFASLPAALAGIFLNRYLEIIFNSFLILSFCFFLNALLLISTFWLKKRKKELNQLSKKDAFLIGCFQAISLFPGISRSGSTIVSALYLGYKRKDSFNFSFYLGVLAMLGVQILKIGDFKAVFFGNNNGWINYILGFSSAFFSGFLSLFFLKKIALKAKLHFFGFYCLFLSLLIILSISF